jgi:DNA repair protein RAD57
VAGRLWRNIRPPSIEVAVGLEYRVHLLIGAKVFVPVVVFSGEWRASTGIACIGWRPTATENAMTDLLSVLPNFPVAQFSKILHALDRHSVTTTDVLTLSAADLAQRVNIPVLDLRRFGAAVQAELHRDLGVLPSRDDPQVGQGNDGGDSTKPAAKQSLAELTKDWATISTLDDQLDAALGGGIPTRRVTEITGESATAKTQFLLTLLLAVQLPPPRGLGRPALYISTESPLSTRRLSQILENHPLLKDYDPAARPTLDMVVSTVTPDLESQDHILQYQVPVEIQRRDVGLLVIDSIAANYRAEFDRGAGTRPAASSSNNPHGSNMAARTAELVKLGAHLRDLARRHNLAVVVSNQVSDRFSARPIPFPRPPVPETTVPATPESPLASRSRPVLPQSSEPPSSSVPYAPPPQFDTPVIPPVLHLDHQQRFFTGWGDDPLSENVSSLKTPSLGLVWSTQVACRIVLFRKAVYSTARLEEDGETVVPTQKGWRRWMKVVFSGHAPSSGPGLDGATEFEVTAGGLRGVGKNTPEADT